MSSVTVISGIIILLVALVCYAFALQTIQAKREKRKRLLAALKSQARSFKFMLSGCPEGFLSKELTVFVLRNLIDVLEQLSQLESAESSHRQEMETYSNLLLTTQQEAAPTSRASLETLQQIKEVRMSLEELHRYVFHIEGQNKITRAQADAYRAQIKVLVLLATVDGYILNARQAMQKSKAKLALHYFELAQKSIVKEGKADLFENKLEQIENVISELRTDLTGEDIDDVSEEEKEELDAEWDKFADTDDTWKKKQFYD